MIYILLLTYIAVYSVAVKVPHDTGNRCADVISTTTKDSSGSESNPNKNNTCFG